MLKFPCPGCKKTLSVPDDAAGKTGRCPNCKASVVVPSPEVGLLEVVSDSSRDDSPRTTPSPNSKPAPPTAGRSNSLGIASVVLGAIAFAICWIPFLGLLGVPLGGLGAILGTIGLVASLRRSGSGIGFPIAGTAISVLALIVCTLVTAVFSRAVLDTGKAISDAQQEAQATNQVVIPSKPENARQNPADVPAPPEAEMPPEEQWASAREIVEQGDIRIRVTKVAVQKIPLQNLGRSTESEQDLLSVHLQVLNTSPTKKLNYLTWRGRQFSLERDSASLTDNFDNTLKRINFGLGTEIEGAIRSSESIYPGKAVDDVLAFEAPIDATEYLRLTLPAQNFGGTGNIRLQIPKEMIER